MAELLAGIEQLAPARALKASFVAYPVVNALHILAVGALLTSVLLMDLRIVGLLGTVPRAPFVALLRRVSLAAFAGAVVTGLLLFSVRASEYAAMPVFLLKMGLILAAGANFLAFALLPDRSEAGTVAPVTAALAVISMALWTAVLFCGRFIGFL